MPQVDTGKDPDQGLAFKGSVGRFESDIRRVLVVVKAYPRPSRSMGETECVAGICDNQWIRLYPVPFRDLASEATFKRWQWITLRVSKSKRDHRTESFVPDCSAIQVAGSVTDWAERGSNS